MREVAAIKFIMPHQVQSHTVWTEAMMTTLLRCLKTTGRDFDVVSAALSGARTKLQCQSFDRLFRKAWGSDLAEFCREFIEPTATIEKRSLDSASLVQSEPLAHGEPICSSATPPKAQRDDMSLESAQPGSAASPSCGSSNDMNASRPPVVLAEEMRSCPLANGDAPTAHGEGSDAKPTLIIPTNPMMVATMHSIDSIGTTDVMPRHDCEENDALLINDSNDNVDGDDAFYISSCLDAGDGCVDCQVSNTFDEVSDPFDETSSECEGSESDAGSESGVDDTAAAVISSNPFSLDEADTAVQVNSSPVAEVRWVTAKNPLSRLDPLEWLGSRVSLMWERPYEGVVTQVKSDASRVHVEYDDGDTSKPDGDRPQALEYLPDGSDCTRCPIVRCLQHLSRSALERGATRCARCESMARDVTGVDPKDEPDLVAPHASTLPGIPKEGARGNERKDESSGDSSGDLSSDVSIEDGSGVVVTKTGAVNCDEKKRILLRLPMSMCTTSTLPQALPVRNQAQPVIQSTILTNQIGSSEQAPRRKVAVLWSKANELKLESLVVSATHSTSTKLDWNVIAQRYEIHTKETRTMRSLQTRWLKMTKSRPQARAKRNTPTAAAANQSNRVDLTPLSTQTPTSKAGIEERSDSERSDSDGNADWVHGTAPFSSRSTEHDITASARRSNSLAAGGVHTRITWQGEIIGEQPPSASVTSTRAASEQGQAGARTGCNLPTTAGLTDEKAASEGSDAQDAEQIDSKVVAPPTNLGATNGKSGFLWDTEQAETLKSLVDACNNENVTDVNWEEIAATHNARTGSHRSQHAIEQYWRKLLRSRNGRGRPHAKKLNGTEEEVPPRKSSPQSQRFASSPRGISKVPPTTVKSKLDAFHIVFICPITQEIMVDPYITRYGNSYERTAIMTHLQRSSTDPLTRLPLDRRGIFPNNNLLLAIVDWRANGGGESEDEDFEMMAGPTPPRKTATPVLTSQDIGRVINSSARQSLLHPPPPPSVSMSMSPPPLQDNGAESVPCRKCETPSIHRGHNCNITEKNSGPLFWDDAQNTVLGNIIAEFEGARDWSTIATLFYECTSIRRSAGSIKRHWNRNGAAIMSSRRHKTYVVSAAGVAGGFKYGDGPIKESSGGDTFIPNETGGEKVKICVFCGEQFQNVGHLERHERTHTGETPYGCSLCGRRFKQKEHAMKHKRTHETRTHKVTPSVLDTSPKFWDDGQNAALGNIIAEFEGARDWSTIATLFYECTSIHRSAGSIRGHWNRNSASIVSSRRKNDAAGVPKVTELPCYPLGDRTQSWDDAQNESLSSVIVGYGDDAIDWGTVAAAFTRSTRIRRSASGIKKYWSLNGAAIMSSRRHNNDDASTAGVMDTRCNPPVRLQKTWDDEHNTVLASIVTGYGNSTIDWSTVATSFNESTNMRRSADAIRIHWFRSDPQSDTPKPTNSHDSVTTLSQRTMKTGPPSSVSPHHIFSHKKHKWDVTQEAALATIIADFGDDTIDWDAVTTALSGCTRIYRSTESIRMHWDQRGAKIMAFQRHTNKGPATSGNPVPHPRKLHLDLSPLATAAAAAAAGTSHRETRPSSKAVKRGVSVFDADSEDSDAGEEHSKPRIDFNSTKRPKLASTFDITFDTDTEGSFDDEGEEDDKDRVCSDIKPISNQLWDEAQDDALANLVAGFGNASVDWDDIAREHNDATDVCRSASSISDHWQRHGPGILLLLRATSNASLSVHQAFVTTSVDPTGPPAPPLTALPPALKLTPSDPPPRVAPLMKLVPSAPPPSQSGSSTPSRPVSRSYHPSFVQTASFARVQDSGAHSSVLEPTETRPRSTTLKRSATEPLSPPFKFKFKLSQPAYGKDAVTDMCPADDAHSATDGKSSRGAGEDGEERSDLDLDCDSDSEDWVREADPFSVSAPDIAGARGAVQEPTPVRPALFD